MANISYAFGNVTVTSDTLDSVYRFLELQKESEKDAYYNTTLDEDSMAVVDDSSVSVDFTASGRWSFYNNIGWFFSCLKGTDLENTTFSAVFSYTDEEAGVGLLCESAVTTQWENGQSTIVHDYHTDYDYTAQNLINLGFYDNFEIFDRDYVLDNKDYILKNLDRFDLSEEDKTYVLSGEFFKTLEAEEDASTYYSLEELIDAYRE